MKFHCGDILDDIFYYIPQNKYSFFVFMTFENNNNIDNTITLARSYSVELNLAGEIF